MSKHRHPIRILQIGKFYPPHPGGMETHLEQLSTGLRQFADVRVLVSNADRRSITERRDGVLVHRAGTVAQFANTPISPDMVAAIRHSPAEIVHIHWPNPTAVLAYLASGHKGRLVLTYHSDIVKQRIPAFLLSVPWIEPQLAGWRQCPYRSGVPALEDDHPKPMNCCLCGS